jgi:hypothetical protein
MGSGSLHIGRFKILVQNSPAPKVYTKKTSNISLLLPGKRYSCRKTTLD